MKNYKNTETLTGFMKRTILDNKKIVKLLNPEQIEQIKDAEKLDLIKSINSIILRSYDNYNTDNSGYNFKLIIEININEPLYKLIINIHNLLDLKLDMDKLFYIRNISYDIVESHYTINGNRIKAINFYYSNNYDDRIHKINALLKKCLNIKLNKNNQCVIDDFSVDILENKLNNLFGNDDDYIGFKLVEIY